MPHVASVADMKFEALTHSGGSSKFHGTPDRAMEGSGTTISTGGGGAGGGVPPPIANSKPLIMFMRVVYRHSWGRGGGACWPS